MNTIARENQRIDGVMAREDWDLSPEQIDQELVGFALPLSINGAAAESCVAFKIKASSPFTASIFRLGYYQGKGARLIDTLNSGEPYPAQAQLACHWPGPRATVDCSNWQTTITYTPPADVPSGFYLARLITTDGPGIGKGRLIPFLVRDDSRRSAILLQVSDTTWQAYNLWTDDPCHPPTSEYAIGAFYYPTAYGGGVTHASYARPFTGSAAFDSGYGFERFYENTYPMIRWLERIGADVSYTTGQAVAQDYLNTKEHPQDSLLLPVTPDIPRLFLTVGHDEYWSQEQRNTIERARAAGVHLMFLSGNQMYWKIAWAGAQTIICEKTSNKIPPLEGTQHDFTGRWSDTRYLPSPDPADARGPENSTTGTVSAAMSDLDGEILVSPEEGRLRFWRGTAFAEQGSHSLDMHRYRYDTLGHECNYDVDNGYRPAGILHLSSTPTWGTSLNFGVGDEIRGRAASYTHHLTLFRDQASGAFVFHGGAIDVCKQLDGFRSVPSASISLEKDPPALALQRGLVNLFADMGLAKPATLPDATWWTPPDPQPPAPSSRIVVPAGPITVKTRVRIEGTATAVSPARVAAVEIAIEDEHWHPTIGYERWQYWWTPSHAGSFRIRSRAVDDWGTIEEQESSLTIQVQAVADSYLDTQEFQSMWGAPTSDSFHFASDHQEIEVGTHFTSSTDGLVYGVRWYRSHLDRKAHHLNLWQLFQAGPTLLTSAVIAGGEDEGWISVPFERAVRTIAGATYIASIRSASGYTYTSLLPHPSARLRFIQAGYNDAGRDRDGFLIPHSSTAGAPLTPPQNIFYLVEPLYRPTSAIRSSFWPEGGVTPKSALSQAGAEVEVGTEWSSEVDGYIVAVRFFNRGGLPTYTVRLWGADLHTPLQESQEPVSDTGIQHWHEIPLKTPLPIAAHTRYTVSYRVPISGTYGRTDDYFVLAPVSCWPFHTYGGVSTLGPGKPTERDNNACYFVDVVFQSSL